MHFQLKRQSLRLSIFTWPDCKFEFPLYWNMNLHVQIAAYYVFSPSTKASLSGLKSVSVLYPMCLSEFESH